MTNQLAIIIGALIIAAFAVDIMWFGTEHMLFLGKKMFDLIEWLAFWR